MSPGILFIGHRGCAGQYPENTVLAFRRAGEQLPAVEVDIQRCGSGELVAFHDETLERLTEGSGAVSETSWELISELDVLNSGEPIPRFEHVLRNWPTGVTMNLDIHDPTIVRDALESMRISDFNEHVILSSTEPNVLEHAREWRSHLKTVTKVSLGYSFHTDISSSIDTATEHDCTFIHVPGQWCRTSDVVDRAHDAGLAVDAWTIRDRGEATQTASCNVDAMTVDRWEFSDIA